MEKTAARIRGGEAGALRPGPLAFHPDNPLRPPDWRWRRARQLHEGRLRARRRDDPWVRGALRVAAALGRHGDAGHPRVVVADPPLAAALELYAAADPRRRLELEARLLAGQDDGEIAGRLGLGEDVVSAYHAAFFDVRAALEQVDRLAAVVFGPRLYDGSGASDSELAARLVGYHLGPAGVDAHFGRTVAGVGADDLAREIADYVSILVTPVTVANAARWLALAEMQEVFERRGLEASAAPASGPIAVDLGAVEEVDRRAAVAAAEGGRPGPEAGAGGAVAEPRSRSA